MNVWDRLEPHFTKSVWQEKAPPRWMAVCFPALLLRPDEKYSVGLYLRQATVTGMIPVLHIAVMLAVVLVSTWHQFPQLYEPRYHKALVGVLSHHGIYWLPSALFFFLLFNFALHFPKFAFWNRRAARLQSLPPEQPIMTDTDPTVWPPAPLRPTR